jgi:hypothetical protein
MRLNAVHRRRRIMTADEVRRAIDALADVMQPYFDARADRLGIPRQPSLMWDWEAWDEVRAEYETLLALYQAQPDEVKESIAGGAAQAIAARALYRTVPYQSRNIVLASSARTCA